MANKDLRDWIAEIEAAGELHTISGADTAEEIGGIVDLFQRGMGQPAVMFDEIPGYPKDFRVMANLLTSVPRINIALGLPPDASEMDLIHWWRDYMRDAPSFEPTEVNGGPLLENVTSGKDVDITTIPTPKWHEHDGGQFIGTACMVVMKDPDSGWINYGTYRVQSHGPDVATVMISPGKHGLGIMEKYHQRGEPCPVAVVVGMHPALFMLGGLEIPYGQNEFEAAGGIFGESVEIVRMPKTGLPVPANAEIAFEGFIHPDDTLVEGPLGEWTGYYAGGQREEPAIRIETMMHRDNPILMGAIPAVPPNDNTFYLGTYRCGAVWNQLEAAGIPEIKGVWAHEAGGSRFWLTVAIKQMYGGHAKQAGLIASQCHAGAYCNRWTVVVDDDIDPTNINQVIWAMSTRFDPRDGLDVLHGGWSSHLDPMCYDGDTDRRNSRLVIDACRPWRRRDSFPTVARSSPELDDRIRAKFAAKLPKGV
ncbi:MAG: UbiD family decarboxylase [Alphaproteobacteria bacterium]